MARERYIGYGRVSRVGSRAEKLRSPEIQERELRQAAAAKGGEVVRVELDLDESGAKANRPGLVRAIESIEAGEADGIVVASLDRFSRNLLQALTLVERVQRAGGTILSYAENPDWSTPDGELQVDLNFSFAAYQHRKLSLSFMKSKQQAVARGIPIQPLMPPGLLIVRDEHGNRVGVEHDLAVTPSIVEIFKARAAGAGPAALSDLLAARRVETAMGSTSWSKPAVYGLLKNRAYVGELRNGPFVNPKAWKRVISEELWQAAQHPQTARRASHTASRAPALLSGIARCWTCRHALARTTSGRGHGYYRCAGRHAGGRCPDPARIREHELDEIVLRAFWHLADQLAARSATETDTAEVDALQAGVAKARSARDQYRDDDDLPATIAAMGGKDVWREGMERHTRRVQEAERVLAEALARQAVPDIGDVASLRKDWDSMPITEHREALARLIDVAAVKPRSSGLPLDQRVVVFSAGAAPADLPRRGFRKRPGLVPFDDPVPTAAP